MTEDFKHGPISVRHDFTIPEAVGISIRVGDAVIYVQSTPRGRKAGIAVHQGRITHVSLDVTQEWRGRPTSREAVENEHRRTGVTVQRPTASPDAGMPEW